MPAEAGGPVGTAEADRRPVTVLFADVSGFTALGERIDPEEIRAFQHDFFQAMAAVVERFEGLVEKFVGDAVMAIFGAPLAHEDDPERALRAALAMQREMERLNQRWEPRLGGPLAIHVGVNTGAVVAGNLGSAAGATYAVTGDTVNTAARLQGIAQPGQIVVGEATYRLAGHAFEFEALGEIGLKGKREPLPVYRLGQALAAPRSARGLEAHGLVAPLIGRGEELGQMLAAFDRMGRGRTQVVSLVGEAGAGKSRLVREFFRRLEADGRRASLAVRRAACSSLGEQAYGVLAAFVRNAYGVTPDEPLDNVRAKLAAGLEALGTGPEETAVIAQLLTRVLGLEAGAAEWQLEPEQLQRQIFVAARTLLERRLQDGPMVLVVEDLHWADSASVELLRFVVDRLADRPLMVLATHRPSFEARQLVTGRATHTVIRLAPLSPRESGALLDALFGGSAARLPASVREVVVSRSGGNPFYLEEILRGLIAGGVLVPTPGGWTCAAEVASEDVPPTIQGLLLSRIDRLPARSRRLLQEAAVLGPTFDAALLRLVATDAEGCDGCLELLQEAELVAEIPRGPGAVGAERQYRFTHALVHEVVYDNLLLRRRTELHERAGQALERLCGERPARLEDLESLGHHWSLSADKARGARYVTAAGDWARAIYANADAVRHYRRALETLAGCGPCEREELTVRERLGDLLGLTGERAEALEHYGVVLRAHAAAGDRPAEARLHRKIARLHWDAGDRDRALAECQTGLRLLPVEAEHIELAHLYQEMGRMAFRAGDHQHAREWAERALGEAERLAATRAGEAGDETDREIAAAIAQACNTLGVALARAGRSDEAVRQIERSAAVAEARGLLQAACRSYANLGVLYSTLDPGRAIETCANGLEVARKIGDLGVQSRLYANLAVAYCALTNQCDEQGVSAAQAAFELDRRLGLLDHLAVPLIVLGQIYQCHGEPDRALAHYQEALALAEEAGEPQLLFPCYDGLATLYLERGDEARAEEYLRKARDVCERAGVDPDSLVVLPFLD